jgi:lipid II:glycine glycyltransferase (peptidoglycan interpeptide bridge formation enzyme)
MDYLQADLPHRNWRYVELRPLNSSFCQQGQEGGFQPAKRYYFHRLDLRPDLDYLFRSLHRDSAQRRILRAERAGVVHERGRSEKLLKDFYDLLVLTRRRHHFPPQPYQWFFNLIECMQDALDIRVAYKAQVPIAAVLILRFRKTIYYKYGCSDAKFKHLGGMPLLLWKTIEESKTAGAEEFDLGRSDTDNSGLISFKNHWAQAPTELVYWRFPEAQGRDSKSRNLTIARWVFACLPKRLLRTTGRLLYRHIG